MKKWYVYLIAAAVAGAIYLQNQNIEGIIGAIIAFILGASFPIAIEMLQGDDVKSPFYIITGLLAAIAAYGVLHPALKDIPSYVSLIILAVLTTTAAYSYDRFSEREPTAAPVPIPVAPVETQETDATPALAGIKMPKILDTSIVIDGRIIDLASTGFVEGPFIVPNFVLRELQLISDSPDPIKRNRGRRGLDMLNNLQKRESLEVQISYKDYTETREVDAKLMRLAKDLTGKLITNDFNLNKVAELQGIEVLNINNLANALKPVVLPGEEMELQVVKEGKDDNQGIGYLDDGTMVVIENGGKLMGKKVKVSVTSIIQTNAGKMIFTKVVPKN